MKAKRLEANFVSFFNSPLFREKWYGLLHSSGLKSSSSDEGNLVLHHVLQHFWSCSVLHESPGLNDKPDGSETVSLCQTSSELCSSSSLAPCIEDECIKEHAGWVMKRVRDVVQHGHDMYKI